jgi:hypothetical protein
MMLSVAESCIAGVGAEVVIEKPMVVLGSTRS